MNSIFLIVLAVLFTISPTTYAGNNYDDDMEMERFEDFERPTEARADRFVIVSMGASETNAFNASTPLWNPWYSWSGGRNRNMRVNSHYHRLKKVYPNRKVYSFNVAIEGAGAKALLEKELPTALWLKPDYVTIMIGGNDLCFWGGSARPEQIEEFEVRLAEVVQKLVGQNSEIQILLAPVPDMNAVQRLGSQRPACQWLWDTAKVCRRFLDSSVTDESRRGFRRDWIATNAAIQRVANKFSTKNVRHEAALAYTPVRWENISKWDCFHPSINGQNEFARLGWEHGFYPDQ